MFKTFFFFFTIIKIQENKSQIFTESLLTKSSFQGCTSFLYIIVIAALKWPGNDRLVMIPLMITSKFDFFSLWWVRDEVRCCLSNCISARLDQEIYKQIRRGWLHQPLAGEECVPCNYMRGNKRKAMSLGTKAMISFLKTETITGILVCWVQFPSCIKHDCFSVLH